MKPFIQVLMPTGHLYEVPTAPIAENRAKTMLELHPDEFKDVAASMEDTDGLFEDHSEIRDWALNNMQVDEVMRDARLIRFTPPELDLQEGDWSYHDGPAMLGELEESSVLDAPVMLILQTMAARRAPCNVTLVRDSNQTPIAMLAVVAGGQQVVSIYAEALEHLTKTMFGAPGVPPAQH